MSTPVPVAMHRWLPIVLVCACSAREADRSKDSPAATAAWSALQQRLPGSWIATTGDATVPVSFRVLSRESVILETFGRPGRETVTTYHLDGTGLVATHYCAQGNQPRLRMQSGDAQHPQLAMVDATGHDPGEPVLVELSFDLTPDGGFGRTEVYRQPDGALERTVWSYAPAP